MSLRGIYPSSFIPGVPVSHSALFSAVVTTSKTREVKIKAHTLRHIFSSALIQIIFAFDRSVAATVWIRHHVFPGPRHQTLW